MFGIWDLFRLDFRGCLDDFGDDFCKICGWVLICFSYSVGGCLGGRLEEFHRLFLGRII